MPESDRIVESLYVVWYTALSDRFLGGGVLPRLEVLNLVRLRRFANALPLMLPKALLEG